MTSALSASAADLGIINWYIVKSCRQHWKWDLNVYNFSASHSTPESSSSSVTTPISSESTPAGRVGRAAQDCCWELNAEPTTVDIAGSSSTTLAGQEKSSPSTPVMPNMDMSSSSTPITPAAGRKNIQDLQYLNFVS